MTYGLALYRPQDHRGERFDPGERLSPHTAVAGPPNAPATVQRIAIEMLTPKRAAACRRDSPPSTPPPPACADPPKQLSPYLLASSPYMKQSRLLKLP